MKRAAWLILGQLMIGLCLPSSPATAEPVRIVRIVETATFAPGSQASLLTSEIQFIGVRFFVSSPAPLTLVRVGGAFGLGSDVFGALVSLTGQTDYPDSRLLSTPDVLATMQFVNPAGESADVVADLNIPLVNGWYALVFGGGLFGTPATAGGHAGGLSFGNIPLEIRRFFLGGALPYRELPNSSVQGIRIFADVAVPAAVPEPSTLLLLATGAAVIARRTRKSRQQRA